MVYITASWQTAVIAEHVRSPGTVPPPVLIRAFNNEKDIQTAIHMQVNSIEGFPLINQQTGTVSLRMDVDVIPADTRLPVKSFSRKCAFSQVLYFLGFF
jgi:hypothetical protein